jgi:hypothetical protein
MRSHISTTLNMASSPPRNTHAVATTLHPSTAALGPLPATFRPALLTHCLTPQDLPPHDYARNEAQLYLGYIKLAGAGDAGAVAAATDDLKDLVADMRQQLGPRNMVLKLALEQHASLLYAGMDQGFPLGGWWVVEDGWCWPGPPLPCLLRWLKLAGGDGNRCVRLPVLVVDAGAAAHKQSTLRCTLHPTAAHCSTMHEACRAQTPSTTTTSHTKSF